MEPDTRLNDPSFLRELRSFKPQRRLVKVHSPFDKMGQVWRVCKMKLAGA